MDWAALMPPICRWQAFRSCHCHLQIGTHQGHCQRLNNKSICHLPLGNWNPCCYSCWLSTTWSKFRVEWGTHSVLQGIWWDRPLNNWMFLEQMLRSQSLNLLISSSVQFSRSVVSNSLRPHGLQHARPPCPSPTPRVCSNSCPLSQWWHTTISSSVVLFSSCPLSFPASGSFQMSQFLASGGQSIWVSASTSVLPMNIQDWFPLGWIGWISLQSKGLSKVFSNITVQKHQVFCAQLSL